MPKYHTRPYADALAKYQALTGIEDLQDYEKTVFNLNLNDRLRKAYESYPWPEFLVVGEAVTLTSNNIRFAEESGAPQAGAKLARNADTVLRVHKQNPRDHLNPGEYLFLIVEDTFGYPTIRMISGSLSGQTVYVTYRVKFEDHVNTATTPAGTTGKYGPEPGDNPDIPLGLYNYAVHGAFVDYLRSDGQSQKAIIEEQVAQLHLTESVEKIDNSGQQHRHDIVTERPVSQFRRHQGRTLKQPVLPGQATQE